MEYAVKIAAQENRPHAASEIGMGAKAEAPIIFALIHAMMIWKHFSTKEIYEIYRMQFFSEGTIRD